jgi:orotate phosphoribosyltransferase
MHSAVAALVGSQSGHFLLESGFHGNLWMDLEGLFLHPAAIEPLASELAGRLAKHEIEAVCGPLVEGAFLALLVARELGVPFTYSERYERQVERTVEGGLYPFGYRVPATLHPHLRRRRIAVVNDVISAGSAVRGTCSALGELQANTVAIGALLVTGAWSARFAAEQQVALESLETMPYDLWPPENCPLCARGEPLVRRIQSV